ncbi:uncharacterized protein TM35_000044890 [Trypanosoma theileri]|uniref:Mitochondrial import inner membrane translocase subunit TIM50 n=1 Tax=Trypanosoma theileri TaxID=67003 RepID=A0A1X0P5X7_9TRYP|nr:uncharacterized protein TM35_000044890 [Trypanosoma theileri]ORC92275.1 hypothetical protein TM35_000044890 [Trypanosoma theileri]
MAAAHPSIRTERFEVDQYVRVELSGGRAEIGVVVALDEPNERAVIATRNGYEITVNLSSVRRAFLLVLDLNGVLVARGRGTFVDRPGVDEFVRFVMNNFVVAVWTSGLERTSIPIIEKIFDNYQDRLLFKFYRSECTERPTPENSYRTIKNLQRIFDAYPKSFHAVNTIIVDDSPDKCSHPDIALCPVPFNDPKKQVDDNGLAMAMEVLKEVLRVESHAPLIRASEERLAALAAKEEQERKEREEEQLQEEYLVSNNNNNNNNNNAIGLSINMKDFSIYGNTMKQEGTSDTFVGKQRLCCDNLCGRCTREHCRFSHDPDDGKRPCSKKNFCRRGHAQRWTDKSEHEVTAVETTTQEYPKGPSNPVTFDVSNIVSFFSTNPDQQKQHQNRQFQDNLAGINVLKQEEPKITRQHQDPKQNPKQEKHKEKYKQDRRQKDVRDSGHQWEGKNLSLGKGTDREIKGGVQSLGIDRGLLHDTPATTTTTTTSSSVSGSTARRFTGDTRDGGALLRNLQASLLGGTNISEASASGEPNRRKNRR